MDTNQIHIKYNYPRFNNIHNYIHTHCYTVMISRHDNYACMGQHCKIAYEAWFTPGVVPITSNKYLWSFVISDHGQLFSFLCETSKIPWYFKHSVYLRCGNDTMTSLEYQTILVHSYFLSVHPSSNTSRSLVGGAMNSQQHRHCEKQSTHLLKTNTTTKV